jgi:hypothetical protein
MLIKNNDRVAKHWELLDLLYLDCAKKYMDLMSYHIQFIIFKLGQTQVYFFLTLKNFRLHD